jgi:antitoxin ParD1/3/4
MPTRNVNLTEELDRFVHSRIESGRYESASEVMRAALRTLEREELEHEARLTALRTAIDEGEASGIATDGVFAEKGYGGAPEGFHLGGYEVGEG